jgi:Saxitoxin biosynthesis operon protein SxtJ
MINPFLEVNWRPGPVERRKFAQSLVVGFPSVAVALLFLNRIVTGTWRAEPSLWIGGAGAGLGVLLLLFPPITRPFYVAWYFVACCMGLVISNVLFVSFYLLVLTPIGLLLRDLGRPPLRKAPDKQAATYWQPAEQISDPKRYYRQF